MIEELRKYVRATKEYRLEYGPFPPTGPDDVKKGAVIRNISAGGVLFQSRENFPLGHQLVLSIYFTGWKKQGEEIVEAPEQDHETVIKAIAEITRCEFETETDSYAVGVKFLGRILD